MKRNVDRPEVTVVVVHFNAATDLESCLESVVRSEGVEVSVVVVENSTNENDRLAAAEATNAIGGRMIDMGHNAGFAQAVNQGVKAAATAWVLALNQDATVHPTTIAGLWKTANSRSDIGAAAPIVVTPGGRIWFAGGRFNPRTGRVELDHFGAADDLSVAAGQTGFISGCAVLLKKRVFEELGGFDERFFLYWEDVDLSLRLLRGGHTLHVAAAERVVHRRGQGGDPMRNLSPAMLEHTLRSRRIFASKQPWSSRLIMGLTQPLEAIRLFVLSVRSRPASVRSASVAILRGLVSADASVSSARAAAGTEGPPR